MKRAIISQVAKMKDMANSKFTSSHATPSCRQCMVAECELGENKRQEKNAHGNTMKSSKQNSNSDSNETVENPIGSDKLVKDGGKGGGGAVDGNENISIVNIAIRNRGSYFLFPFSHHNSQRLHVLFCITKYGKNVQIRTHIRIVLPISIWEFIGYAIFFAPAAASSTALSMAIQKPMF